MLDKGKKTIYFIGFDEVGRGALAGPVVVAGCVLTVKSEAIVRAYSKKEKLPLRDSKKLSPRQRNKWIEFLNIQPEIRTSISFVSEKIIDAINISNSANRATYSAFQKIKKKLKEKIVNADIVLDGGLFIKNKAYSTRIARTMPKADEDFLAVSLASIVAKEARDAYMKKMDDIYPQYQFARHKGYGSRLHAQAITTHGPSPAHRLTFLSRWVSIDANR